MGATLRTTEAEISYKTKNNEARPKFTGSYKKKSVWLMLHLKYRRSLCIPSFAFCDSLSSPKCYTLHINWSVNGHFCCIKIVSIWRILREKHTYNILVNEKCRQQPHLFGGKLPSSRIFSGTLLKSIEYRQIDGIDQNMLPFLFHIFHSISISAKILESTEMMLLKQLNSQFVENCCFSSRVKPVRCLFVIMFFESPGNT